MQGPGKAAAAVADSAPSAEAEGAERSRSWTAETRVSVVVPCYNEAATLPILYERLSTEARRWNVDHEVILVDDGSQDGSWEIMRRVHAQDPRWKMISFARNYGHQTALWAGLHLASGNLVAVLDADLQDPPEVLAAFFEKWRSGYDVIYGVRQKRKEGLLKRAAYFFFYRLLSRLAEIDIPLDSGDFCVMDRRVVDLLKRMPERRRFIRGLRSWIGYRKAAVPYERHGRAGGETKYTFRRLVELAVDGVFSFSSQPLRLATYFGGCVSMVAFLGALFTLLQRIFAKQFARIGLEPVPGFATTVIAVLFLGGIQLLCLGIIGEYIGRIYEDVKQRPMWTVRDTLGVSRSLAERLAHTPPAAPLLDRER